MDATTLDPTSIISGFTANGTGKSSTFSSSNGVVYFHVADYLVLVIMLVFSLAIGVYYGCFGGKQKTTHEYFKGNKNMSLLPVVLSLMASYVSSSGMLGTPAEVYHHGFNYIYVLIGSIIGIPASAYLFLPVFYDMQITSVFEYLERRFDRRIRICGSILSIITLMIYASFVAYSPALALSQVTGLHLWGSIITTTVIGTIYTSLGGIKAVMWTDSMQMLVITLALLVAIIKGTIDVGGLTTVLETSTHGGRLEALSFSFDPRVRFTFWGMLLSTTLGWIQAYGISQIQVQRYMSCSTRQRAQRGLWYNFPGMVIVIAIYCFIGLVLYAKYATCDPRSSNQIEEPDQILPLFIMSTMSSWPGLPGLFVAGVYSASLSTTSSVLNSLAAVTLEDYIRPSWKGITDERATTISKWIAIAYGVLTLIMIVGIAQLGSILQACWYLVGGSNGANFGLFTLGMFIPWANTKGSLVGVTIGLGISWWISLGNQIHKPVTSSLPVSTEFCNDTLGQWTIRPTKDTSGSDEILEVYKLSYLWIMPLAWFLTVFIGAIASRFFGTTEKLVDPELFSPVVKYYVQRNDKGQKCVPVPTNEDLPPPYVDLLQPLPAGDIRRKYPYTTADEEECLDTTV